MSVKLMSQVYDAHFHDIEFLHSGKKKSGEEFEKKVKVLAPNLKSVCLALADHANDEGEGAYPSIEKMEDKTELSHVTVIACLKAMKQEGIISLAGISKWATCNYTINKKKVAEMAGWERQKREKPGSKAALATKAALLEGVKPLYKEGKAALVKPSINHQGTIYGATAPNTNVNPNTGNRTDAKVKGDPMDGILAAAKASHGMDCETRIQDFPPDVQETLRSMVTIWSWPAAAIPAKPKNGDKGGAYAQWINELRLINNLIDGYGKDALLAVVEPCAKLTVSHPAAITWALPGEIGKLQKRKERKTEQKQLNTDFSRAVELFEQMSPEEKAAYRSRMAEMRRQRGAGSSVPTQA